MDNQTRWNAPPAGYALPDDEVHVWRAGLDWPTSSITKLKEILSSDERARAERFHFEIDHRRHVVGRGVLRLVLARCLGASPHALRFDHGARGKPSLAAAFAPARLQFNVSHSGELVLVALTIGRMVGVDVEHIRHDLEVEAIAQRFFSARENSALATLASPARRDAFYACWTRKEAYIKAVGDGLALPLDQFDVAFLPGEPARLVATRPNGAEAGRWSLRDLDAGHGYRAALAVAGAGWRLATWDWPTGACSPDLLRPVRDAEPAARER